MKSLITICTLLLLVACGNKQEPVAPAPVTAASAPAPGVAPATQQK